MPYGTASIIGDNGEIAAKPPTPVFFTPSLNPDVNDGDWVYFERRPTDPTRASIVRRSAHLLVALATPDNGVTTAARRMLRARVDDELAALKADGLDHEGRIAAWEDMQVRMDTVATVLMDERGPAGVAVVRATLDKA